MCGMHCKKILSFFPSPAGMSLTKHFMAGNYLLTSRLGKGKTINFFLQCAPALLPCSQLSSSDSLLGCWVTSVWVGWWRWPPRVRRPRLGCSPRTSPRSAACPPHCCTLHTYSHVHLHALQHARHIAVPYTHISTYISTLCSMPATLLYPTHI
jgi:hypothetical protein